MKKIIKNLSTIFVLGSVLVAFAACSDDDESVSRPNLSMPEEGSVTPIMVSCDAILAGNYSHSFTLTIDEVASTTMMGDVKADESLVETFNTTHGTNYNILPSNIYTIPNSNVMIAAGQTESNEITVNFTGTLFGLEKGQQYLLPLVVEFDETVTENFQKGTSAHYIAVDVDREVIYTPGLLMSTYSTDMYSTLSIPNNEMVELEGNTHTFEMRIYCYSWHSGTNYLGTWRGRDTNNGNEAFSGCEVRVTDTGGASNIGNRQCDLTLANQNKTIPTNKWVTLTITCDGTQTGQSSEIAYRLYFNGELISEAAPTKRYGRSSSQGFQVGYTLTGFQFGYPGERSYYFDGLIGEIRIWKDCLTQAEILENLQTVENPSKDKMYAYWKINEGEGNTLKDYSGNDRDLTFPESSTIVWGAEMEE